MAATPRPSHLSTMSTLLWIVVAGVAMSAIALVGSVTLLLTRETLARITLTLVALAAGSLLGGAFFHMLPAALSAGMAPAALFGWTALGFLAFFVLEQFLHFHHCHDPRADCREPLGYLILVGDALHNFLGGLAIGGIFLVDVRLGWVAWVAAALHEVPQELGDFGVLVHGGWPRGKALLFNLGSGLTFLAGGLIAYGASTAVDVAFLIPFAAGNFLYIGATDLVPELHRHGMSGRRAEHAMAFAGGLALLWLLGGLAAG